MESQAARFERSWYDFVQRAFDDLPIQAFALEGGGEGWRYGIDPSPALGEAPPRARPRRRCPPGAPAWRQPNRPWRATPRPPAWPRTSKGSAPSPLAQVAGLGRYRRGDLIHRLLQLLPDLPPADRAAAAHRLLARERDLTDEQRAEMAAAALAVLDDARFAAVFGPGSRAEAALAGARRRLPADLQLSGRVDRLLVEPDRVLVVDFKTNRPAPDRIEDADPAYVLQMAVYGARAGRGLSRPRRSRRRWSGPTDRS